jgi:uncharacterized membrane protein
LVYDFYEVFLIFFFWGFAGWLVECIDMRIEAGEFQNRGFLHMPFCPIYGVGMAAGAVALSGLKDSYVGLFVFGVIFCSVVEYIVGGILERLFHSKWWDYSHMRFNIKGRVCLRNAVLFGFGAIVVFRFAQPVVERVISRIPMEMKIAITVIFGIVFVIDLAASTRRAWTYRKKQQGDELMLIFKAHR